MEKRIILTLVGILALMLAGCGRKDVVYLDTETAVTEAGAFKDTPGETEGPEESTQTAEDAICYVYVCGAVLNPGVYPLSRGSRIYQAIEAAGGLSDEASPDCVNQAEPVFDGQMISVLTREEAQLSDKALTDKPKDAKEGAASDGKVNINTAGMEELMTLPGVGESKAKSILSYQEDKGGFDKIEDIMNITGIKEGVFTKIKEDITVD